ncbi:hypothetical protein F5148DRAFT_141264 [Russula earlei]|uniref:Uncharacterized protein n=1 Tax=Russula earlei TaxID=71964 RepID=A0ACC0U7V6_9AGAM|nr:hypothetical protein F5148DRAFT_141264 [Russula earlei]
MQCRTRGSIIILHDNEQMTPRGHRELAAFKLATLVASMPSTLHHRRRPRHQLEHSTLMRGCTHPEPEFADRDLEETRHGDGAVILTVLTYIAPEERPSRICRFAILSRSRILCRSSHLSAHKHLDCACSSIPRHSSPTSLPLPQRASCAGYRQSTPRPIFLIP